MSNIESAKLNELAANFRMSKNPESIVIACILEEMAKKEFQGLVIIEKVLSTKSEQELSDFLDKSNFKIGSKMPTLRISKEAVKHGENIRLFSDISENYDIRVNGNGIFNYDISSFHPTWIEVQIPEEVNLSGKNIEARNLINTQITDGLLKVNTASLITTISNFVKTKGWNVEEIADRFSE